MIKYITCIKSIRIKKYIKYHMELDSEIMP